MWCCVTPAACVGHVRMCVCVIPAACVGHVCVYVCVCACVFMYVCVHVYVYVCGGGGGLTWHSSSRSSCETGVNHTQHPFMESSDATWDRCLRYLCRLCMPKVTPHFNDTYRNAFPNFTS